MRTPVIMHVDMDAFYASVEMAERPELRHRPMFVGGSGRGVVLSANYPARSFGIAAGMPTMRARRLCPGVVVIPPDFDRYQQVSGAVSQLFEGLSDRVEMASIDEAFIDLTGALRRMGADPVEVAERLRAQVSDEQQVTCSAGIGPNKFVAKLASRAAKPDGVVAVTPGEVVSFLHPLPVEAIWGVGEATAARLRRIGLGTVREVANTSRQTLQRALGDVQGGLLADLAWGRDDRTVEYRAPAERSVSAQETFQADVDDAEAIETAILKLAERVASKLRAARLVGRTISLSVRFADFTTITRSGTLNVPTDLTGEINAEARKLFRRLNLQRARIRRVGVKAEKLAQRAEIYLQPTLDEPEHGWAQAEAAMDDVVFRFGPNALRRARLTGRRPPGGVATVPPAVP